MMHYDARACITRVQGGILVLLPLLDYQLEVQQMLLDMPQVSVLGGDLYVCVCRYL